MKYIITDEQYIGMRIDQYINNIDENITRNYAQKLIEEQNILLNGEKTKSSYKLKSNDEVEIMDIDIVDAEILPENIPLDIIYEDQDIIIVNKEKGMVVHPGNGNTSGTLVNALMFSHKDNLSQINGVVRPGIVHRIDKDTSGILVVAKTDKAHKILSESFKRHDINRKYIALVKGIVEKDNLKINLPIGRDNTDRKKMAVTTKNSKEAITYIKVLERFYASNYTLIEATLETGRTHQIRVHMTYVGHPLMGDTTYSNGKNEFGIEGQMLHAKLLGINHPITGKYMEFEVDVPKEFKEVLNSLRKKEDKCE